MRYLLAGYEFMMSGTFDNAYFTSSTPTGHLYVIGNTGPAKKGHTEEPVGDGVTSLMESDIVLPVEFSSIPCETPQLRLRRQFTPL